MKRFLAFSALLLTAALPSTFAQSSSSVGTWKYDATQSDFGSQPKPKSMTLVITKDTPQMLAWHVTEIDAAGKTVHESWSGPQDGSMHTLRATEGNGQAGFQNNNGELSIHWKMPNGMSAESQVTNSDEGKTMTEHVTGTAPNGQPFTQIIVWRKVTHRKHKTM